MTKNPRRRLLRRARYATAGIVVTAVAGTAGLTAVAASAIGLAPGTPGDTTGGTTGDKTGGTSGRADTGQGAAPRSGTGIGTAPAPAGQPQGGSNAS